MSPVSCFYCGYPFGDNIPGSDPLPCPTCGAMKRAYEYVSNGRSVAGVLSVVTRVEWTTYPQELLTLAEKLMNDGEFGISVLVAHVAGETASGYRLSRAFADRGIADLEPAVTDLIRGSNFTSDRAYKLYLALTKDKVRGQTFWLDYKKSVSVRNEVAHKGRKASQVEAELAIVAATALVKHLGLWGRTQ